MQRLAEAHEPGCIEFDQEWEGLRDNNSFRGKVDMDLPRGGLSAAKFSYPTGRYSVESSDHWGIGIVRRPFEVEYFASGQMTYGRRTVHQGQIVLSEPNSEFDAKIKSQGEIEYLVFSQGRFSDLFPHELGELTELPHGLASRIQSNLLTSLVSAMLEQMNRNAHMSATYVDAIADAVIAELLRDVLVEGGGSKTSKGTLSDAALETLQRYIRANMQSKIDVTDLANCLGVAPAAIRSGLKARNAGTPYQLILNTRVQCAQSMLATTDASAAKVAFDCGFSSQSHMSDVFRQKLGKTPGQVRRGVC
ncbi:MAG: helix-turn-helix transcriptional regulator [Pseudomonadota bacterium]